MEYATIINGLYRGTDISGNFPIAKDYEPHKDLEHGSGKDGRIKIVHPEKNGIIGININFVDVIYSKGTPELIEFDSEQAGKDIQERFKIQSELIDGTITGKITSLIIAGAAGVGKSYEVENRLNEAVDNGEIVSFVSLKGKTTGIGLYDTLHDNKDPGQVLVLDDIDSVFQDEDALNLLKAALDTSLERNLTWNTRATTKGGAGFKYEGAIIFITNLNFDKMIAKDNRMTPHYQALLSRSLYLDLKVHTLDEILIRINQVVEKSNMLQRMNLDNEIGDELMQWINHNYHNMRELSLRTVIKLAGIMQSSENWERTATITLLK